MNENKQNVDILNSYDNTKELLEKFPVLNPTHVEYRRENPESSADRI